MSAAGKLAVDPVHQLMTWDEYMAFDADAETKHEFIPKTQRSAGGEILGYVRAMSGASMDHTGIKDNLAAELRERFKGGDCIALTSDMKVRCESGRGTFPDIVVVCGPREVEPRDDEKSPLVLRNPKVVVEVLSDSTEADDRGQKFADYRSISSLKEYILIPQDGRRIDRYVRTEEGWLMTSYDPTTGDLPIESLDLSVPMAEVFRGIELFTD